LLAKISAAGPDRETARRRLVRALKQTVVQGLASNRAYLIRALSHPAFIAAGVTTGFVDEHAEALATAPADGRLRALAAALLAGVGGPGSRGLGTMPRRLALDFDAGPGDQRIEARVARQPGRVQVSLGAQVIAFDALERLDDQVVYTIDGHRRRASCHGRPPLLWLSDEACDLRARDRSLDPPETESVAAKGRLLAPMDATVVAVEAAAGQAVERGRPVVVIEAMKMEMALKADIEGVVETVVVAPGDAVRKGQLLAVVVTDKAGDG